MTKFFALLLAFVALPALILADPELNRCREQFKEEFKQFLHDALPVQRMFATMAYQRKVCKTICQIRVGPMVVKPFEEINSLESSTCTTEAFPLPWVVSNKVCKGGECLPL